MTVDDLLRELSELSPIDRTLQVVGVEFVQVRNGEGRNVFLFEPTDPWNDDDPYDIGYEDGYAARRDES